MLQRLSLVAGMSASSAAAAVFTVTAASADAGPPTPATKAIPPAHPTNKKTIRASEVILFQDRNTLPPPPFHIFAHLNFMDAS